MLYKSRKLLILGTVIVVVVVAASAGAYFLLRPRSKTVAQVNGTTITQAELDQQTSFPLTQTPGIFDAAGGAASQKEVDARNLQAAINQQLLLQEAKKRKISVTGKTITAAYSALTKSYADPVALKDKLKAASMTEAELKSAVADNLTISALTKSLVTDASATEAKLQAYYNTHKDRYAGAGSFDDLKAEIKADYLNDARSAAVTKLAAQLEKTAVIIK